MLVQLIPTEIRRGSIVFILAGLILYWADYKGLKNDKKFKKEAKWSKLGSLTYIFGGISVVILCTAFDWWFT